MDAINLRADTRGMGRYVRAVLRGMAGRADVALTLLVRDPRDAGAYREIVGAADVAPLAAARERGAFAVVWFPWNAMRFAAHAPAVVTINDDFAFRYPAADPVARWREQQPIRRAVKRADRIATISQWSRTTLIERFALRPEAVDVIPLAPDRFFCAAPDAPPTSPFAEPFVLAVGTRESRKNVGFLLDVMTAAFPAAGVRLVLVGPLPDGLRRRAQTSALPLTELRDVDDEALRRLYRTATIVAVPSLAEGFGLVAAEAQACGAAVIAANTAALPETVGDAGLLVDPGDAPGWTRALRDLVDDPARNAAVRARALNRWPADSGERTAEAVFALLQRTIDDRT